MIKSKLVSSAISLAILCSVSAVNAEAVVGQLVAKPSAIISDGSVSLSVGDSATAYIEGDSVTTGSNSSATISLTSGVARIVIAPNSVMSVVDAEEGSLSLDKGAISVSAEAGQVISIATPTGSYDLVSNSVIDAVVAFENGELSVLTKSDSLVVTSQNGAAATSVEPGLAFISNGQQVKSVDVQSAGTAVAATTTTGATVVTTSLVVGGIVVGTAVVGDQLSDGDEADDASPQ